MPAAAGVALLVAFSGIVWAGVWLPWRWGLFARPRRAQAPVPGGRPRGLTPGAVHRLEVRTLDQEAVAVVEAARLDGGALERAVASWGC